MELLHKWHLTLDKQGERSFRILLLDCRKAFSFVDHTFLLSTLASSRVHDGVIRWFTAFLCEWRQHTKIGSCMSDWCVVNAGVPCYTFQSFQLCLHISNLQTRLPTYKYMDNTTMWQVCDLSGSDNQLQQALEEASRMSLTAGCPSTVTKARTACRLLVQGSYCPQHYHQSTDHWEGRIHQAAGCNHHQQLVLGCPSWQDPCQLKHITETLFSTITAEGGHGYSRSILAVHASVIRSLLEYACPSWYSSSPGKLESIQRSVLHIVFLDLSYREDPACSNLPTLHKHHETLNHNVFCWHVVSGAL